MIFDICYVDAEGWSYFYKRYEYRSKGQDKCAKLNKKKKKCPWKPEVSRKWDVNRYLLFERKRNHYTKPLTGERFWYSVFYRETGLPITFYIKNKFLTKRGAGTFCKKQNESGLNKKDVLNKRFKDNFKGTGVYRCNDGGYEHEITHKRVMDESPPPKVVAATKTTKQKQVATPKQAEPEKIGPLPEYIKCTKCSKVYRTADFSKPFVCNPCKKRLASSFIIIPDIHVHVPAPGVEIIERKKNIEVDGFFSGLKQYYAAEHVDILKQKAEDVSEKANQFYQLVEAQNIDGIDKAEKDFFLAASNMMVASEEAKNDLKNLPRINAGTFLQMLRHNFKDDKIEKEQKKQDLQCLIKKKNGIQCQADAVVAGLFCDEHKNNHGFNENHDSDEDEEEESILKSKQPPTSSKKRRRSEIEMLQIKPRSSRRIKQKKNRSVEFDLDSESENSSNSSDDTSDDEEEEEEEELAVGNVETDKPSYTKKQLEYMRSYQVKNVVNILMHKKKDGTEYRVWDCYKEIGATVGRDVTRVYNRLYKYGMRIKCPTEPNMKRRVKAMGLCPWPKTEAAEHRMAKKLISQGYRLY